MKSPQLPLQFKIVGMDCAEKVAALKRVVGPVAGGEEHLAFDILNGKMTVQPSVPQTFGKRRLLPRTTVTPQNRRYPS